MTAGEALELLRSKTFDLVLLDIMMPEMNGYEVLEHLKADAELRHLPVIMISAVGRDGERGALHRARRRGLPAQALRCDAAARAGGREPREEGAARRSARLEQEARRARAGAGRAARSPGPAEGLLFAAARGVDRQRRRRRPAEDAPPRSGGRLPRPARLHRLHRQLRARGGHGRARRISPRDGAADHRPTKARSSTLPATAS